MKKTLSVLIALMALGTLNLFAELSLTVSAEPANPVPGDTVVWTAHVTGAESDKSYTFSWGIGDRQVKYTPQSKGSDSFTNSYDFPGDKTVNITAYTGGETITRGLTVHVYETVITVTSPAKNDTWKVGDTYTITWDTRGMSNVVQIGLWDFRYNTEVGNNGETLIAFQISNTGSYSYTVPPASADGISAGNLGGKNYYVSVSPWNDGVSGWTKDPFVLADRQRKH